MAMQALKMLLGARHSVRAVNRVGTGGGQRTARPTVDHRFRGSIRGFSRAVETLPAE